MISPAKIRFHTLYIVVNNTLPLYSSKTTSLQMKPHFGNTIKRIFDVLTHGITYQRDLSFDTSICSFNQIQDT